MKREQRYLVLKIADIERELSPFQRGQLAEYAAVVEIGRASRGKPPLECVVVESDWPEYEPVWKMIADRVDGVPKPEPVGYFDLHPMYLLRGYGQPFVSVSVALTDDVHPFMLTSPVPLYAEPVDQSARIAELIEEVSFHKGVSVATEYLVRELDVLLNGEEGAAKQASLCDLVSQVRKDGISVSRIEELEQRCTVLNANLEAAQDTLVMETEVGKSYLSKIAELEQQLSDRDALLRDLAHYASLGTLTPQAMQPLTVFANNAALILQGKAEFVIPLGWAKDRCKEIEAIEFSKFREAVRAHLKGDEA